MLGSRGQKPNWQPSHSYQNPFRSAFGSRARIAAAPALTSRSKEADEGRVTTARFGDVAVLLQFCAEVFCWFHGGLGGRVFSLGAA
jgi:hypothetical protein